ncbi:MAG: hypothetical protein IJN64_02310 [Lachnospiraceae bacterium]|nr:hypothetical protein [Lachnospiraceae bacterium]
MNKSKELAIIIYSCWKNSDMWLIFMKLLKKYWDNCKYKVILLTDKYEGEKAQYGFDDIVTLDSTWYEMIMAGIECAGTEYVMLWMDDYLLCDYVKNEDIDKYIQVARKYSAANIRLVESSIITGKEFAKDNKYNYYEPGTAYSISTQVGIWNVEFLKTRAKKEWSPWDFERKGSIHIKDYEHPILAPKDYAFPYEEGVRRGKWMDSGIKVCKRNNIKIDFSKRKQMSNFELAWAYFKGGVLQKNPTLIVKIQNLLLK